MCSFRVKRGNATDQSIVLLCFTPHNPSHYVWRHCSIYDWRKFSFQWIIFNNDKLEVSCASQSLKDNDQSGSHDM